MSPLIAEIDENPDRISYRTNIDDTRVTVEIEPEFCDDVCSVASANDLETSILNLDEWPLPI